MAFALVCACAIAASVLAVEGTRLTLEATGVASQANDGTVVVAGGLLAARVGGSDTASVGIRFPVPEGTLAGVSHLDSAHLVVTAGSNADRSPVSCRMRLEDTDAAAVLSADSFHFNDRSYHTAAVDWVVTEEWTAGSSYTSPDLGPCLSAVLLDADSGVSTGTNGHVFVRIDCYSPLSGAANAAYNRTLADPTLELVFPDPDSIGGDCDGVSTAISIPLVAGLGGAVGCLLLTVCILLIVVCAPHKTHDLVHGADLETGVSGLTSDKEGEEEAASELTLDPGAAPEERVLSTESMVEAGAASASDMSTRHDGPTSQPSTGRDAFTFESEEGTSLATPGRPPASVPSPGRRRASTASSIGSMATDQAARNRRYSVAGSPGGSGGLGSGSRRRRTRRRRTSVEAEAAHYAGMAYHHDELAKFGQDRVGSSRLPPRSPPASGDYFLEPASPSGMQGQTRSHELVGYGGPYNSLYRAQYSEEDDVYDERAAMAQTLPVGRRRAMSVVQAGTRFSAHRGSLLASPGRQWGSPRSGASLSSLPIGGPSGSSLAISPRDETFGTDTFESSINGFSNSSGLPTRTPDLPAQHRLHRRRVRRRTSVIGGDESDDGSGGGATSRTTGRMSTRSVRSVRSVGTARSTTRARRHGGAGGGAGGMASDDAVEELLREADAMNGVA